MSGKKFTPNEIDVRLGKMICLMRNRMGYSQKDLARLIGVTFQQVQKYETADNRISASRLYEIARAMEIPVARFFNEMDHGCLIDAKTANVVRKLFNIGETDQKYIFWMINRLSE